jgi:hypothetical protein
MSSSGAVYSDTSDSWNEGDPRIPTKRSVSLGRREPKLVGLPTVVPSMDNGTGMALAERTGIAELWRMARDLGGIDGRGLATAFGAQGSPMTVIYSSEGEPVDVICGGISGQALARRALRHRVSSSELHEFWRSLFRIAAGAAPIGAPSGHVSVCRGTRFE